MANFGGFGGGNMQALMKQAAANLDFEMAIKLREEIKELKKLKD